MATRAYAVVGASYGDEGKGSVTDVLASHLDKVLVVRHNSGAQCSHTVMRDGVRHVFSHFGAGTMAGAPTFLSRHFVVHPSLFMMELNELNSKGIIPKVIVDAHCRVTTPFDVMLNRWAEEDRGENRHGSCGIGFGETIEAGGNLDNTFSNFFIKDNDLDKFISLTYPYYMHRAGILGIKLLPERLKYLKTGEHPSNYGSLEAWANDYRSMLNHAEVAKDSLFSYSYDNIIFEGGQGLLLDQDNIVDFPYLTRSNTGLKNVMEISAEMGIDKIQPIYVTRPYLTRHGEGPLPRETTNLEGFNVVDKTNETNKWQGSLRFAPMDWDAFNIRVGFDWVGKMRVENPSIAITCIDQAIRFDIPPTKLPISILRHGIEREDTEFLNDYRTDFARATTPV